MAEPRAPRGLPLLSGPAPSQPQDSDSCRKCGKEFNIIFSRSRKCNHCGFMYCHGCTDYQALMPRIGPDTGYDVMNVCGYCVDYLTITAGGRTHLKSLPIAKLRQYANAYNINITRAVEKNDIIDTLVNARTQNGCLPRAHENYYRKNSIPASESRPGLRNMFRSSSNAPPPPPPRDTNPPRHQQFARPDLAPDPPFNHNARPPPPPPRPQQAPPPPPNRPQQQGGAGGGYHPQYQQGFHSAPPPQDHYGQGHYGPPPGPPPGAQSYGPPPPQPGGGYPGQQWHQQQQTGWGQQPGYGYPQPPHPGFFPPPPHPPPHGGFYAGAGGYSTPPPPPPPRSPRPSPQQQQRQATPPPPPPPPRPRSAQPEAQPSSRGRTTSAPSGPPPVPNLDALLDMTAQEIKALSIGALKSILFTNHVNAGQVLEKGELVKKVEQLVEAERLERQRAREREEMEEMERLQREQEREEERERARQRARDLEQQQEREREAERERERRGQQASQVPDESGERIHITRLDPVDDSDDEGVGDHHAHPGASATESGSASGAADNGPGGEKSKEIPKPAPPRQGPSPAPHYQERTGLCVVCQDEEANIAIVDCGHLAMCRGCSDLIMASSRECPLCRTRIVTEQRLLRIFKT